MSQRSNQGWLEELRGNQGPEKQLLAHEDLANYLYTVVYNYLLNRRANMVILNSFSSEELAALAEDFVQETMEKLADNHFALLDKFEGRGRFTSWAAQIARNQAGQELRKAYWRRRVTLSSEDDEADNPRELLFETISSNDISPEIAAAHQQVAHQLEKCIKSLSERSQYAVWQCLVKGQGAKSVADKLEVTVNTVYLLIYRAKRNLKKCLHRAGIDHTSLDLYE